MAVLSVASGLAWAGAAVDGLYQGDSFGPVSFRYQGDRLVGTAGEDGPCGFETHQTVVEGSFQGNVLVGEVTLCQRGPNCGTPQQYPVLLVFNPEDNVLSGVVRLGKGCESPVLDANGMLVLKAVAKGASLAPKGAPEAPAPAAPAPSAGALASAASVAARNSSPAEEVASSLAKGQKALAAMDAASALPHFVRVLAVEPGNAVALTGRGASLLGLGQAKDALTWLEQARDQGARQPEPHFWLAGAHLRLNNRAKARESLQQALRLGWAPPSEAHRLVEAELNRLAAAGNEFEPMVKLARGRKRAPSREPQGLGSPTP